MIAEPAHRYRRAGAVERLANQAGRLAMPPAIRRNLKRLYHAALALQTGGRGLPCTLPGGEVVRVLPQFGHVTWNPDEYRAFRASVQPGMTALDVGSNLGAYSLLLGHWVGPSGSVFAFEPAAAAFDGLMSHVRLNGLEEIVHPVAAAVAEREGVARLLVAPTGGESRLAAPDETGRAVTVPTISIDAFCRRGNIEPGFIKIDVEGHELAVLRGARETIRRARASLVLFVEMHPSLWPSLGISRDEIVDELRRQELEPVPLVPGGDVLGPEGVTIRLTRK